MILIPAFVAQQHGWAVILRDEQVGRAVAVVIAGDDGARIFQLNFVETNVGGDVFESVGAEVAEEADFGLAGFGLAGGDEVDPAVVVVVEGGDAPSAPPVCFWKGHLFKATSTIVAPEGDS